MNPESTPDFASLPQSSRQLLLEGQTILLVTSYHVSTSESNHQKSVAEFVVPARRMRQLQEQSESMNCPCYIECPVLALKVASPALARFLDAHPEAEKIEVNMGCVLPGFLMDVLHWYCNALYESSWTDYFSNGFSETYIEREVRQFYLYGHTCMRALGMDSFANKLLPVIQPLVNEHSDYVPTLPIKSIVSSTSLHDPLLRLIAQRLAYLASKQESPITVQVGGDIAQRFPHFADMLNEALMTALSI